MAIKWLERVERDGSREPVGHGGHRASNPLPPPPPEPSRPQQWLEIAASDRLLADALTYFGHGKNWFDTYKAFESIEYKYGGPKKFLKLHWVDEDEIELLKWTANYYARHARRESKPPPAPMGLPKARELVARLIARAFAEAQLAPSP